MIVTIGKKFKFHAAHYLPPGINELCENIHGHTYHGTLFVRGQVNNQGILCEAGALKLKMNGVVNSIDHSLIVPYYSPSELARAKAENDEVQNAFIWGLKNLQKSGTKMYYVGASSTVENLVCFLAQQFCELIPSSVPFFGASQKYELWVELWETPTFVALSEKYEFKINHYTPEGN